MILITTVFHQLWTHLRFITPQECENTTTVDLEPLRKDTPNKEHHTVYVLIFRQGNLLKTFVIWSCLEQLAGPDEILECFDEKLEWKTIIRTIKVAVRSVKVVAPIRGYHIYQDVWTPASQDRLLFKRENGKCVQE